MFSRNDSFSSFLWFPLLSTKAQNLVVVYSFLAFGTGIPIFFLSAKFNKNDVFVFVGISLLFSLTEFQNSPGLTESLNSFLVK